MAGEYVMKKWDIVFKGGMALAFSVSVASADHRRDPRPVAELTIPSCSELNQLWRSRYHRKLKAQWPLQDVACGSGESVIPSVERAFAEAAYILENTRYRLDRLPAGYSVPPANLLDFITDKYLTLEINPKATWPSTDIAKRALFFYPAIANETGYSVVGNLIHESRHADGDIYEHVDCIAGPSMGRQMCDDGLGDDFDVGGPHRIASLYFAWAAARSNWPPAAKEYARTLAKWVIEQRINATDEERAAWATKYLQNG